MSIIVAAAAMPMQAAPVPGTVTVLPPAADDRGREEQPFADAVKEALAVAGFLPLPGVARYAVRVGVERRVQGTGVAPVGRSGVGTTPGRGGTAVWVPFATRKLAVRALVVTTVTVRLQARDGAAARTGIALTAQVAGTPDDAPTALAKRLAPAAVHALLDGWPEPVSVP